MEVNYITLINRAWSDLPNRQGFRHCSLLLFLAISDSINRNHWRPTALPYDYLLNKTGVCKKTYLEARKWLVDQGYLTMIPGRNAYQMATFGLGVEVHEKTATDTTKVSSITENRQVEGHKKTAKVTHFKTRNINTIKTLNIEFDTVWDLYSKKEDRLEAEKLWIKLTDEERQTALNHIPGYIASTPDKTYRLKFTNYLKKKSFYNEVLLTKTNNNGRVKHLLSRTEAEFAGAAV